MLFKKIFEFKFRAAIEKKIFYIRPILVKTIYQNEIAADTSLSWLRH